MTARKLLAWLLYHVPTWRWPWRVGSAEDNLATLCWRIGDRLDGVEDPRLPRRQERSR